MKTYSTIILCLVSKAMAFSVLPLSNNVLVSNSKLQMGLFDMFSPEAKAAREAAEAKKRAEQEEEIRLMQERRRNPEKMQEYQEQVKQRRDAYAEDRDKFIAEEEEKGAA
jgi:hypothetical protein